MSKTALIRAVEHLVRLQGSAVDAARLKAAAEGPDRSTWADLNALCQAMGWSPAKPIQTPDPVLLPLIVLMPEKGWGVLVERWHDNAWRVVHADGEHTYDNDALKGHCAYLSTGALDASSTVGEQADSFERHLKTALGGCRGLFAEIIVASLFISILALVTSLFSMQVYDRVIPTRGEYTLIVLSVGVLLAIGIEMVMKMARSRVMDRVTVQVDQQLSRQIFQRLMDLRVDQMPPSVGSLASQLRGYEQVRAFYASSTLYTLVDAPVALLFIIVVAVIGTPLVASVPLTFAALALLIGVAGRRAFEQLAGQAAALTNLKTGLLVEAVEGIETIKGGSGGWKLLSRWVAVNGKTIQNDLQMRHNSDNITYWSAAVQQLSYAGVVVAGSWGVMQGHMTMGALIACSILSGRILSPIMALPSMLVQHAHSQAALKGLEALYKLQSEHHGISRPLTPGKLNGHFQLNHVTFAYGDNPPALRIDDLVLKPGERVGIIGPIGAGKSTLLRLLSGLYRCTEGSVLIDGLDISHISREVLSRQIGYLQQDHRLFLGTLRENLLIGLPDPGDDVLQDAMTRTGMIRLVSAHPKGLDRPISEGGKGLSGGQRQLVAFTRLLLSNPSILLLDEPTATMDEEQERRCVSVLKHEAALGKSMVIVTHKNSMLPLVERLLVVAGNRVVLDGPRDAVLQHLKQAGPAAIQPQPIPSHEVKVS